MNRISKEGKVRTLVLLLGVFFLIGIVVYGAVGSHGEIANKFRSMFASKEILVAKAIEPLVEESTVSEEKILHVAAPMNLKAVYLTSWAAGNEKFRKALWDVIDNTEVNAVVIDIKDYTGKIGFYVSDPELQKFAAAEDRIPDVRSFIEKLHEKGVYVIGRISCFQDSHLVKAKPEWAVKSKANGGVWKDYKGIKWLDPGAKPVWDYLARIGYESYAVGFDEINFDYIRFPSDGNMMDVVYSWSEGRTRQSVMKDFFAYLRQQFPEGSIPISADLFGLTTSADGDLGIGQNITDALPYFDSVYPMVYPSHYPANFNGYAKPAKYPYEVVKYAMDQGSIKAISASTSPHKIKPWIQAFDLGAVYTPDMIKSQVRATYDAGMTGWLMWNAGSIYKTSWFEPKTI